MITLGAKFYFGLTVFCLAAAAVLGLASGGTFLGVISFGWTGPVGDNLGFTVLAGLAGAAFFLGAVTTAFRDADSVSIVQYAGTDTLPAARPPADLSPWPVVAAFGVAMLVIGLVVEPLVVGLGILMLAASAIEWSVTAYADLATGDPAANRAIRNRLMQPIEIPAAAIFGIAFFVFFASRVLLALSKWGAIAVFAGAGAGVLLVASLIASRPKVTRGVLTAVLLLGGALLVVGGVVGIGAGQREFHHLGEEHSESSDEGDHADDESTTDDSSTTDEDDHADDGTTDDGDDTSSGDSEE